MGRAFTKWTDDLLKGVTLDAGGTAPHFLVKRGEGLRPAVDGEWLNDDK